MAEWVADGPGGTEMCEATLPDGSKVTIAVRPGLSQDEVDLLAAQVWAEVPEGPSGEDPQAG